MRILNSKFWLVGAVALCGQILQGQATTVSDADGRTPTAIQPGTPWGSYSISGLDNVNLFNGHLNFTVPIRAVGGRGDSGYSLAIPVERNWSIDYSYDPATSVETWLPRTPMQPRAHWWSDVGYVPHFGPGMVLIRRAFSGSAYCYSTEQPTIVQAVRTTIAFINESGTETELVDKESGGEVKSVSCNVNLNPWAVGFNRQRIFESREGSSMTFVADADVKDYGFLDSLTSWKATGWLFFKNGMRYRVVDGMVTKIFDRNGNRTSISYANGDVQSITDSIGRTLSVSSSANATAVSFPGANGTARTVTVRYAELSTRLGNELDVNGSPTMAVIRNYSDLFGSFGPGSSFNPTVVSEIELPNGKKYQFRYNSYAELVQVQMPTGAQFRYRHGPGNGSFSVVGSSPQQAGVYRRLLQKWTYLNGLDDPTTTPGGLMGQVRYDVTHTAVAPSVASFHLYSNTEVTVSTFNGSGALLSKSKHYFYGGADNDQNKGFANISYNNWRQGQEYRTEQFRLDNSAVLAHVEREYAQRPCDLAGGEVCMNMSPVPGAGDASNYIRYYGNDPRQTAENSGIWNGETSANGMLARKEFDYDRFNNQTEVREFAFGAASGSPSAGSLARKTTMQYKPASSSYAQLSMTGSVPDPLATAHLRNLREGMSLYEGNGSLIEQLETLYDEAGATNVSGSVNERPSAPISGEPFWGTSWTMRGNPTRTRSLLLGGLVAGDGNRYLESTFEYDVLGNLLKRTDPGSRVTQFEYADRCALGTELNGTYAFVTKTINAAGHVKEISFDCRLGAVREEKEKSVLAGNDAVTSYVYSDVLDRLTSITPPVGSQSFAYDDTALTVTTSVLQNSCSATNQSVVSTKRFDSLGRAIREEGSDQEGGFFSEREFDVLGRTTKVWGVRRSGETLNPSVIAYDGLGRGVSETLPDGAVRQTSYLLNVTTLTDEAQVKRSEEMDALGRLTKVIEDPSGLNYQTLYEYDAKDRLSKVTQGVQERNYRYDSAGRLRCVSNPEARVSGNSCLSTPLPTSGVLLYGYDDRGNLTSRKDARGIVTEYGFDLLDRMTAIQYPARPVANVAQSYDTCRLGMLCSVANNVSTNTMSYDLAGRITGSSQATGGTTYNFSYAWNQAGGLDEVTYPSGNKTRSCSDVGSRVREVSRVKSGATSTVANGIGYEGDGAMKSIVFGNGVKEVRCRNGRQQTTGWVVRNGSANGCAHDAQDLLNTTTDYGLASQNNGNVRGQSWRLYLSGGVARDYAQTHSYDSLNRLLTTSEPNASGAWTLTNGYDRYGNRYVGSWSGMTLSPGTPMGPGWFDAATNRLNQASAGQGVTFDNAGNLTAHADMGAMGYDEENRLVSWSQGATAVSFEYDGAGRRVKRTKGLRVTTFVYDAAGQLMAEYDTQPEAAGAERQYRHGDLLDSTRLLTGNGGAVLSRRDFFPFGEEIPGTVAYGKRDEVAGYGAGSNVRQMFTGKERDGETGLDNFVARSYGASLGRFSSVDPYVIQFEMLRGRNEEERKSILEDYVSSPQIWNRYSYALNSPLTLIDPDGRRALNHREQEAIDRLRREQSSAAAAGVTDLADSIGVAIQQISSYVASLRDEDAGSEGLQAAIWAINNIGNANFGLFGIASAPGVGPIRPGAWKCNIFCAAAYGYGAGRQFPVFRTALGGLIKYPPVANELGDPNKKIPNLSVVSSPAIGDLAIFPSGDQNLLGHSAIYLGGKLVVYGSEYSVKLNTISGTQDALRNWVAPVFRRYTK